MLISDWKNSVCRQWLTGWSLALWLWIWQQRPEETLRPPGPVNCTSTTMWHTLVTPTYPADSQPSPVLSTPTTSPSYFCPWVSDILKNTDNNCTVPFVKFVAWNEKHWICTMYFCVTGEKDHFNINLEDEVVRGSIVVQNVS